MNYGLNLLISMFYCRIFIWTLFLFGGMASSASVSTPDMEGDSQKGRLTPSMVTALPLPASEEDGMGGSSASSYDAPA